MKKILRFSKLSILCAALTFFIIAGGTLSSYADSVTVDESIRGPGKFTGPFPVMITAFAHRFPGTPPTFNVLKGLYLFTLFDTGSDSVALSPAHQAFLETPLPRLLDVRINGLGTIDENTLFAPIGPPIGDNPQTQVVGVRVGTTFKKNTLIGAPVANVRVAYIDNREASLIRRGPYPFDDDPTTPEDERFQVGPDMWFSTQHSVPSMESIGKKKEVTLHLERFGPVGFTSEGAHRGQRYYLRNVVFKDGGKQVDDGGGANLDIFWDSGTNFTAISQAMAQTLGLLDRSSDFTCQMTGSTQLAGYEIDSVVMTGSYGLSYTIENARICVDDSPAPFGGIADARIGSNFFDQVPILFHGPFNTLTILSDLIQGDFDQNNVVDCSDYEMLMADIQRPYQAVSIDGYTLIDYSGDLGMNTIQINYTVDDDMVKIKSATYDFTGKNVLYNDETQIFNFPEDDGTIRENIIWAVDLDQVSTGTGTPLREDYIGGKVTLEIIDGTIIEAFFNYEDSEELAYTFLGAAARFAADIPDFRTPSDPIFDLNEDGIVDEADAEMLIGLFDNPEDAPCDSGETVPGDVDGDGVVDINDIMSIFGSIGQPAAPGDPRDYDGDGLITIIDARSSVLECTNPGCAP